MIRRKLVIWIVAALMALSIVVPAFASVPPGQKGYEGQPGNQGGGQVSQGLLGYEGQPGNQGG